MRKPRKPVRQCFNCIDFDPGLLGWILDFFASYGRCLRHDKKVRCDTRCNDFKLAPQFWGKDTKNYVRGEYDD